MFILAATETARSQGIVYVIPQEHIFYSDGVFQPLNFNIDINGDGTISGKQGQLGKVRLVDFANPRALQKQGDSLYSTSQTAGPATTATLQQGMLESSNVQPIVEISRMIEVMRSYEATSTLEKSAADMKRQAVQKLGTVQ